MLHIRATKYDPTKRDSSGRYFGDEFTSASDVGRYFDGRLFTAEDYVNIEDSYVVAVKQLLSTSGIGSMKISELEDRRATATIDSEIERLRPASIDSIYDGKLIKGDEIACVVRMALRETIWCKLLGDNGIYVHFGYDFYMYIGCDLNLNRIGQPPSGMYFEQIASPYLN